MTELNDVFLFCALYSGVVLSALAATAPREELVKVRRRSGGGSESRIEV